jgi:hypothetical protein
MSAGNCCKLGAPGGGGAPRPGSRARRGREVAGWVIPGVILALIPKCPACLAAYVAIATGIGLSMPAATYLRAGLLISCIAALGFLAARRVHRICAARRVSFARPG